jgi:hypothetical protein
MKKIILISLLISLLVLLTGCTTKLEVERQAIIIMPDNSLIKGTCTNMLRYGDNWIYVKVDGIEYYLDSWRLVLWNK